MHLIEVRDEAHVEILRQLRNECREFMTHHNKYISPRQQTAWWKKVRNDPDHRLYLLSMVGEHVGFGYLRKFGNPPNVHWWSTYGLAKKWRGVGFGVELVDRLLRTVGNEEVWADVLRSNKPSIRILRAFGFEDARGQTTNDRLIVLRRKCGDSRHHTH